MKFAIIGGDLRTVKLAEMLAKDENEIYICGLEKAEELKDKPNIIFIEVFWAALKTISKKLAYLVSTDAEVS